MLKSCGGFACARQNTAVPLRQSIAIFCEPRCWAASHVSHAPMPRRASRNFVHEQGIEDRKRPPNFCMSHARHGCAHLTARVADLASVVDASVGLKWVLDEEDSHIAAALAASDEELLVPDFWLNEACNVIWLQVRRGKFTPAEGHEALALLRMQLEPTSTADLHLHDVALDLGTQINHSTYDTMYVAFAIALGAHRVIAADRSFVRAMRKHRDPAMGRLMQSLDEWGVEHGL